MQQVEYGKRANGEDIIVLSAAVVLGCLYSSVSQTVVRVSAGQAKGF